MTTATQISNDVLESYVQHGDEAILAATKKQRVPKHLEERKRRFEEARDLILADVPDNVKGRFGGIFFTKWRNDTLPCLALNPYSVPPETCG